MTCRHRGRGSSAAIGEHFLGVHLPFVRAIVKLLAAKDDGCPQTMPRRSDHSVTCMVRLRLLVPHGEVNDATVMAAIFALLSFCVCHYREQHAGAVRLCVVHSFTCSLVMVR